MGMDAENYLNTYSYAKVNAMPAMSLEQYLNQPSGFDILAKATGGYTTRDVINMRRENARIDEEDRIRSENFDLKMKLYELRRQLKEKNDNKFLTDMVNNLISEAENR